LAETQREDGGISFKAPYSDHYTACTCWAAAMVWIPWDVYNFYADTLLLAKHYNTMRGVTYNSMTRQHPDKPEIIIYDLGDWMSPVMTLSDSLRNNLMGAPEGSWLYGTASHYRNVKDMSEISSILGKTQEEKEFSDWSVRIEKSFNKEFLDKEKGIYHGEQVSEYRQAANAVPLEYGLVPKELEKTVCKNLVEEVHKQGDRLATGFLGTPALIEYLARTNPELAYKIVTQPEYPGYGYLVANGATTIWEGWDGDDSRNHSPYCLVSEYFYRHLAGIQADPDQPGFKHIIIRPSVISGLTYVEAYHDCLYGRIKSGWKREDNSLILTISIPVNTTATIFVPAHSETEVSESGQQADKVEGVEFLGMDGDKAKYKVASGNWELKIKNIN
jgi:alpha-L-rhamnosidase